MKNRSSLNRFKHKLELFNLLKLEDSLGTKSTETKDPLGFKLVIRSDQY